MAAPEGYTPLAIVGYTDKGTYSAGTTYNKYNVVLYDGSSYVAIKDGVTGVTPSNDGVNWRTFANGFPSNGVTTDNFQSTLGNYLANNGTTTNSGFALDARYGKTLQDSVDALNRKIPMMGANTCYFNGENPNDASAILYKISEENWAAIGCDVGGVPILSYGTGDSDRTIYCFDRTGITINGIPYK